MTATRVCVCVAPSGLQVIDRQPISCRSHRKSAEAESKPTNGLIIRRSYSNLLFKSERIVPIAWAKCTQIAG